MILFALVGVAVNFCAALFTREGDSLNQKAVNLHMLEDVLGWLAVLVGAVVMRLTDWVLIDPLMSIAVAVFILVHAAGNLKEILDLLLVKTPKGIPVKQIKERVLGLEGVLGVHHIHLWSMDGVNNYATMHIVTAGDAHQVKDRVRHALRAHGIGHATLELETPEEHCHEKTCQVAHSHPHGHHHH